MATTKPFAYNTGTTISGTEQVGDIAIGTTEQDYSSEIGGVTWWMGPDEDLGYVIAHPTITGNQPNPLDVSAYIGFWRTQSKTESDFIGLSEYVARQQNTPQTFISGNEAYAWLNSNGFWTSYVSVPPTPTSSITPTVTPTITLTPSVTPTTSFGVTFSQTFTSGQAPGSSIETAWTTFRSQLVGSYSTMTLSSSLGFSVTETNVLVQNIADALRTATTNTNTIVTIGSNNWRIAHGCVSGTPDTNSIYLTTGGLCECGGTYTLRPMIKNLNWGGLNGSSCNQPTQTITLTFS